MKKTTLNTGIEIIYDKKGNIKKLKSPYDHQIIYSKKLKTND